MSAATILDGVWAQNMREPDGRPIWEWIAEEGELPNCYAVPGRFDVSLVPFVKEPLEALRNPAVREVVNMSSVQSLKTLIGEFWLLWAIENNPGPTQWLQPTDEEAKEHCEERFLRLLECYPRVHRFFTENRHEKKTASIIFKHMWMRMEGCGLGNLQRKSVKNQMCSEVWQREHWLPGRLKEAAARLTQFAFNSKRYIESQPWETIRDVDGKVVGDDILAAFNRWSQREWGFCCQGCGKLQPWLFSFTREDGSRAAMRWDKTERTFRAKKGHLTPALSPRGGEGEEGEYRWGELVQTLRYECIYCGHGHADQPLTRGRMMASGAYITNNPDAPSEGESFSVNQLCMPGIPWLGQVQDFISAIDQARKGFDLPLRLLFTKRFGKPFDADKHAHYTRLPVVDLRLEDWRKRRSQGEGETTAAANVIDYEGIRFDIPLMGVDVQQKDFWALVQFWNANGDILTVWAGRLVTWEEVREKQLEFGVVDENVMVDSQHRGIEVFQHCTRNGHWEVLPDGHRKVWRCWDAYRGEDREWFYYRVKKGRDKGRKIALVYGWPPNSGDPLSGLRRDDPNREELAGLMREEKIGRYCRLINGARPTLMEVALARRDRRSAARLLTVKGDWNDELNKQWHSQRKEPARNGWGRERYRNFRADHLLDCFIEILCKAFMRQLLGGAVLEEGKPANDANDAKS